MRRLRYSLVFGGVLAAAVLVGCGQVERQMTVTSDPPGALVYVNGREMGRTPVTFDYLWYGNYRFELMLDDHETLRTSRHVQASPTQWPVADLVTEAFVPHTFRDDKFFHFQLDPLPPPDQQALIDRAKGLQDRTIHSNE